MERLAGGPWDIVQSALPTLVPSRTGVRLTTVHDLDFLEHPERTQAEFTGRYAALARRHAHETDHIIAISAYTAGEVEARLGVPRNRITVCRPGRPAWPVRTAPPPASLGYLLFVGTLEPRKNVAGLLEAYGRLVARNPQAPPLVLVGRDGRRIGAGAGAARPASLRRARPAPRLHPRRGARRRSTPAPPR